MPTRGDVWMVDLGMAQKVRPGLILNRIFKDTDRALITVVPHITTLRGSEFEIRIDVWAVRSAPRRMASRSMQLGQRASAPKGASSAPHFAHRRSVGIGKSVSRTLLQQKRHGPYGQNEAPQRKVTNR